MPVRQWINRRPLTTGLFVFLVLWYVLELLVVQFYGEQTALWWFYWEPLAVSPGIILSPISHNIETLTHIGTNSVILLVVGGYAESYLEKDEYLAIVLGLGLLSIVFTNLLAIFLRTQWALAGTSSGLLALSSYIALRRKHVVFDADVGGLFTIKRWKWILVTTLLISIPVVPIYELILGSPANIGHVMGIVVGVLYYLAEVRYYDPPYANPTSSKVP